MFMKGILIKNNDKWRIKYFDWAYESTDDCDIVSSYKKKLNEFSIELDPADAKDAETLCNTKYTLENKEVHFAFKQVKGSKYGKLTRPSEHHPFNEIEQEILHKTTKNNPTTNTIISTELGHKCIICENTIELSQSKQMCDDCLNALKSIILEKRATPKKTSK